MSELNKENRSVLNAEKAIQSDAFKDKASQKMLSEWASFTDNAEIIPVDRDFFEKECKKNPVQKQEGDKTYVFMPDDIKLWELPKLAEKLETYSSPDDEQKAEKAKDKKEKYAKKFEHLGIYIAKRIDDIDKGKPLAQEAAKTCFEYGEKVLGKDVIEQLIGSDEEKVEAIKELPLSDQETETIDRLLSGDSVYEKKIQAIEKLGFDSNQKQKYLEQERIKGLRRLFKIAQGAQEKNYQRKDNQDMKKSPQEAVVERINIGFDKELLTVKKELFQAFERDGLTKLEKSIDSSYFKESFLNEYKKDIDNKGEFLKEFLQIDKMKSALEALRQTGDNQLIAQAEHEVVDKILLAVGGLNYERSMVFLNDIKDKKGLNCVSKSLITERFLDDLDIKHASIGLTFLSSGKHAALVFEDNIGKPYFIESTGGFKFEISPELLGDNDDNKRKDTLSKIHQVCQGRDIKGFGTLLDYPSIGAAIARFGGNDSLLISELLRCVADKNWGKDEDVVGELTHYENEIDETSPNANIVLAQKKNGLDQSALEKLINKINQNKDPLFALEVGLELDRMNLPIRAIGILEKGMEMDGNNAQIKFCLGRCYEHAGFNNKAGTTYIEAINGGLMDKNQYQEIINFFEKYSRFEEANAVLKKQKEVFGSNFENEVKTSVNANQVGQTGEAWLSSLAATNHLIQGAFRNGRFNVDFVASAFKQWLNNQKYQV